MIPVTILTGFLGAGKTTLLNRILTGSPSTDSGRPLRVAVVVNEIGDIGIDDRFIARTEGDIVELTNGCICCTARDASMDVLFTLATKAKTGTEIDHVIIETTGLAKPASLCRFFLADSPLKKFYMLDGVVTVVDAFHGISQLIQNAEAKEQVAVADLILLNKTDLTGEEQIHQLEEWLHGLNPTADLLRGTKDSIPLDGILAIGGFNPAEKSHILEEQMHEHAHDSDITVVSIREAHPLDRGKFLAWLQELIAMHGADLLRYKGILQFSGMKERFALQGVHMIHELNGGSWPANVEPATELVFIGRRLDEQELRSGFQKCILHRQASIS